MIDHRTPRERRTELSWYARSAFERDDHGFPMVGRWIVAGLLILALVVTLGQEAHLWL